MAEKGFEKKIPVKTLRDFIEKNEIVDYIEKKLDDEAYLETEEEDLEEMNDTSSGELPDSDEKTEQNKPQNDYVPGDSSEDAVNTDTNWYLIIKWIKLIKN